MRQSQTSQTHLHDRAGDGRGPDAGAAARRRPFASPTVAGVPAAQAQSAALDASPRVTRRSFVRLAALSALAVAAAGSSLGRGESRADDYQGSAETNAALADAQSRYNDAVAQINELNNAVFDAEAAYESITSDLDATNQQIQDTQASIDQTQAQLSEAQDVLASRVNAEYRAGRTSLLEVLLESTSFSDFTNRLYYANKTADADAQAIQTVRDLQTTLEQQRSDLEQQRASQEQLQQQQADQIDQLNAQVADAESYAASLDGEVQSLIAQRDAEIAAQAEAARQAAEAEAQRQAESAAAQQAAAAAAAGTYVNATQDDSGSYVATDYAPSSDGSSTSSGSSSSGSGSAAYQPADVVSAAYNYLGTPYSVLDCSGLTSRAYGDCGYYLYHQSGVQYNTVVSAGNLVMDASSLVPGNLVFYARGGSIYHVAMYIGDGMIIESIPSSGVAVHSIYYCDGYCGGGSPF